MNNLLKRILCAAMVCALCLSFAACASGEVLATVNGQKITRADFDTEMANTLSYYGLSDDTLDDYMGEDEANAYRDSVLDALITQELMRQKATELGYYDLSEEESADIQTSVDEYISSVKEYLRSEVEAEAESDASIDVDKELDSRYMQFMQEQGFTQQSLYDIYMEDYVLNKVYDHFMEGCVVTEKDYENYYNELLTEQQDLALSDPDSALMNYLYGANAVDVYIPENAKEEVKTVQHILIALPDEISEEASSLESDGDSDGAEQKREEGREQVKAEAEAVLARVQAGEDWDALMAECSADYTEGSDNRFEVYDGAGYVQEFVDGALALQNVGDVSGLIASQYGWHIIKFVEETKTGQIPYADVKDSIVSAADSALQTEFWSNLLDEWLSEAEVTRTSFLTDSDADASDDAQSTEEPSEDAVG